MKAKVPLDVQVIVIEWVYRSSQHQEIDYPTLRACALVCRSWTPVAQRLLFRRVPVPNVSAYFYRIPQITIDLILRTLCAAPYLAAHVRSVICNSEGTDPNSKANDFAILALSTRVDSIFFLERVSPALVSLLSTFPVHPTYIFVNGKSSLVNRVIDIWPSIRILDVATVDKGIPINVPSAIQALSSDASGHRWNYSSAHVPAPPVQALHDLELYPDRMSRAPLAESSVLAQVHTLRLPGVSAVDLPTAVLTGLQSLVIGWLPIVETFSLPRSLRHLGYHPEYHPFEKDEQVQILLAAVRARTELELFTATRYSSPAVLKQFESVCGELGVEFLVYPEPACFPHPRNVDWI